MDGDLLLAASAARTLELPPGSLRSGGERLSVWVKDEEELSLKEKQKTKKDTGYVERKSTRPELKITE